MDRPPSPYSSALRGAWPVVVPAIVGGMYALGHFTWFSGTPLGQVPVLDQREGIAFAEAIVSGNIPAEPFYRAPGYALLLATMRTLGVSSSGLFSAALLLGALLHGINAWLAAAIGRRWLSDTAAVAAGLLYALNPVLVHFAVQAGDATPALTLFLAGLLAIPTRNGSDRVAPWAIASLCWAVATLLRPNYLLLWLLLPLLALLRPTRKLKTCIASVSGAALFALTAAWQAHVSGTPGFLPTQGPYNLWAANRPGSHGRYYAQQFTLPSALAEQNPARAESLLLYERETGHRAPDLGTANAYWRSKFRNYVTNQPLTWATLLGRKLYALLNDWEQYNNETPAFHLKRSPWLRWNPLSWGVLLVLATAGAFRLGREAPGVAKTLAWVSAAAAGSALLFFVSARFRLPLAALATLAAAAFVAHPLFWKSTRPLHRLSLVLACLIVGLVAFSNFDNVRDDATMVQDHALLARAAATVGNDSLAFEHAQATLALRPDHPDGLRTSVVSYFNLLIAGAAQPAAEARWRSSSELLLQTPTPDDPDTRAVAALARWRGGDRQGALTEWRSLGANPSALGARILAGDTTVPDAERTRLQASTRLPPLARLALADTSSTAQADVGLAQIRSRVMQPAPKVSQP